MCTKCVQEALITWFSVTEIKNDLFFLKVFKKSILLFCKGCCRKFGHNSKKCLRFLRLGKDVMLQVLNKLILWLLHLMINRSRISEIKKKGKENFQLRQKERDWQNYKKKWQSKLFWIVKGNVNNNSIFVQNTCLTLCMQVFSIRLYVRFAQLNHFHGNFTYK